MVRETVSPGDDPGWRHPADAHGSRQHRPGRASTSPDAPRLADRRLESWCALPRLGRLAMSRPRLCRWSWRCCWMDGSARSTQPVTPLPSPLAPVY